MHKHRSDVGRLLSVGVLHVLTEHTTVINKGRRKPTKVYTRQSINAKCVSELAKYIGVGSEDACATFTASYCYIFLMITFAAAAKTIIWSHIAFRGQRDRAVDRFRRHQTDRYVSDSTVVVVMLLLKILQ